MKRLTGILTTCMIAASILAACNVPSSVVTTPSPTSATNSGGATVTSISSGGYPKMGHAPDYSWIAGRVTFTLIQGSCVYISTRDTQQTPQATSEGAGSGTAGQVVVGTAVAAGTSPPLREITPQPPGSRPAEPPGDLFVPGGPGWERSQYSDGDYVVLFGRLATENDPREVCPGGTHYVVERAQRNQ